MKAFIGRSLSGRTPGERGDKGSLRSMRGGERFYSQGRRPGQVLPYKGKAPATAAGGVQGLRVGSWPTFQEVSGKKKKKMVFSLSLLNRWLVVLTHYTQQKYELQWESDTI